ncbi:hypothetical protein NONO_c17960 [Nocardia nova SH22a]|uniref:Uncharacterized protein n=1 Tax=Nocardia nova SH22a TaxID=1415166 RepID=W5TH78_9NOCA|nr:hypothetical protein [Nocardia nova]AHH16596.1 hypothetical protein NONO_c17960 [Nocardia nova SH22a]
MTDTPGDGEIVEEIVTKAGRDKAATDQREQEYRDLGNGMRVTPKMIAFMEAVRNGRLPDVGDVPQVDPNVVALAEELHVVHLDEWYNPAGRKLADPTVLSLPQSPRLAEYLHRRGWRKHPELEEVQWRPTPGGMPNPHDLGLHVYRDADGNFPDPDPEAFYDIADIKVEQADNGSWQASHPRGLGFVGNTKSEAYAGLVERLRAKITEARAQQDGTA